jgi:cytochrome P450
MSLEATVGATPPAQCPVHSLEDEYNPFVAPQLNDPNPIWARARTESPVFFSRLLNAFVVSRYADVIEVLRRHDIFAQGIERKMFAEPSPEADRLLAQLPPLENMKLHSSEPPTHTKLRRYLQPALMPHRVAALEPELRRMANALIDEFEPRGHGDFYQDYAYPFPLHFLSHLIGLPRDDFPRIREWTDLQVLLRYGKPSADDQVRLAQSQLDSFAYTVDLVKRRRAEPGDDMLSWLIQDSDASDDPLSDEQLASQATTLLTGGHETTAHFVTMLLHRVLSHREHWAELVADPAISAVLVEEGLRTDGPVQSLWRKSTVDTQLGGIDIPAGSRVSVVLGSANQDGGVFDDAGEFDLARRDVSRHVAFGRGIHTCPGAGVARLEARVTLEVLSARLPGLRLADDDGYLFKPGATQRMAERLCVVWN